MKRHYITFSIISAAVILLDQWTKWYIDQSMDQQTSIVVLENFFQITYIRNRGAAFGILADSSFRLPFFITVSLIAIGFVLYYTSKLKPEQKLLNISLALVFAGAVGNLIDRIRLGEVIDFLYFHWYTHYWPAFNVADSAICVGVGLILVDMIREERRAKSRNA